MPSVGLLVSSTAVTSLAGGACAFRIASRFFGVFAQKRGRRPNNALKSNVMELYLNKGSCDLVSLANECANASNPFHSFVVIAGWLGDS